VLNNEAGNDFVLYESAGDPTSQEGFAVQVLDVTTDVWSPWVYKNSDAFQVYGDGSGTQGAFSYLYDLSDFGVPAGNQVAIIRVVNLTERDSINPTASGPLHEVFMEDTSSGTLVTDLPFSFGSTTLDPDPLYIGGLSSLSVFVSDMSSCMIFPAE
jgi:hypothetical protein